MRVLYILLFFTVSLQFLSKAQTTDGLVLHYNANGNVTDQSGNGSHGTTIGSVNYVADRNGNPSSAINFDGSTSYINANGALPVCGQNTQGTFSTWVKLSDPFSPEQRLLSYYRNGAYTYLIIRIRDGKVTALSKVNGGGGDFHYSTNDVVIQANQWHHVAVTQNGTTGINIFIDGQLVSGSYLWTKDKKVWFKRISDASGDTFFLAASILNGTVVNHLNGAMDDVRLYDRVLSSIEIAELHNPPPPCPSNMAISSNEITHLDACAGIQKGSFQVTAVSEDGQPGSDPYNYEFYDAANNVIQAKSASGQIVDLDAGTYSVVITNTSTNCESDHLTFEIEDETTQPQLAITETQNNTSLDTPNGQFTVVVLNATAEPYTFSWFEGSDTQDETSLIRSTTEASGVASNSLGGLLGGGYWVKVEQGNGAICNSKIATSIMDDLPPIEWSFDGNNVNYTAGNVSIGTTFSDAKLTVKGDIHAERVKVDLNIPAPDYVFEEDYDLRSLEETAAYIEKNKHLPDVPSAKELEALGIDLVEMNMLLLKKIEELTLHVIDLKKENEIQQQRITKLENQ